MKVKSLFALLLLACFTQAFADDRQPPASWSLDEPASHQLGRLYTADYAALDVEALAAEDRLSEALGQPPRFAIPRETGFDLLTDGNWDAIGDTSIWRFRVRAHDAVLINFGFSDLFLPEGAALYVYTAAAAEKRTMDRFQVIGPYTASINRAHGEFWTPNLHADDVVIELNVPSARRDQARFEISQISQGYRAFGAAAADYLQPQDRLEGDGKQSCKDEGGTRSGACNMDVACLDDDDPWNEPRRSVGAYQRSGSFACTGSLVNNTANDQRMLFITATHCINAGQTPSIVVYWNYEWPSCRRPGAAGGTATNPPDPNMSNSGGTHLAATTNPFQGQCSAPNECSDVTLIELSDPPDPDFDLFWSGWDRRPPPTACAQGAPNTTDGLCATIHHPGVHEKRITFVEQDIQVGNIAGAVGIHWHPFWHPNPPELPNMPAGGTVTPGVTEPGSSGSPLYTAAQRFIGVLSGGPAFCGATGNSLSDFYGQLAHAWEGIGTPTTRMRDYLDPLGTNPEFIDGIGTDGFEIVPEAVQFSQCGFDDLGIAIDVNQIGGFDDPVTLSATGLPAGVTDSFTVNNQEPPFATTLTLGNLAAAGEGAFTFAVDGVAGDQDFSVDIHVSLFDGIPALPGLIAPPHGAVDVVLQPEFTWDAVSGAAEYQIQVATDAGFGTVVIDELVAGTSFVPESELATGTLYYWRVRALNACGDGDWSIEFSFTTRLEPVADAAPGSFAFEVPQGGLDADTLFISNLGTGNLVWEIETDLIESAPGLASHDPALDETFAIANFTAISPNNGGSPVVRTVTAGVATRGDVVGFSFQGTVSGVSGNDSWASDMCMIVESPDGATFAVGGFSGTQAGCNINNWDFDGSGSTNDGTYASTHDNVFSPAEADEGEWTFTFINDWASTSAANMNWTNVSITLHKTPLPVCFEDLAEVPWLSVDPDNGSTPAGETDEVQVMVDAAGMDEGEYEAYLCLTTNAQGQALIPILVELTVTEVLAGQLAVDPDGLPFGEVTVDHAEAASFTVSNAAPAGALDIELSAIEVTAGDNVFAIIGGDCEGTDFLSPGDECVVDVSFSPDAPGAFAGEVTVSTLQGQSAQVSLSGAGVQEPGELEVSPLELDFGSVNIGESGVETVTVSNVAPAGAADLDLTQIAVIIGQPEFALDADGSDCGATLAPQASCTVSVEFTPEAESAFAGALRITADGDSVNVSLMGEGMEAVIVPEIFEDRFEEL